MRFSRRFVDLLNAARDSSGKVQGGLELLDRLATAVAVASYLRDAPVSPGSDDDQLPIVLPGDWDIARSSKLHARVLPYLNERALPCRPRLLQWDASEPQVELELGGEQPTLEQVAVTSFLLFLEEMALSRGSGGGRLGLRKCAVCGNVFVQEEVGRTKKYCAARCKFRARRKLLELERRRRERNARRRMGRSR
jgi:hypothetical protein